MQDSLSKSVQREYRCNCQGGSLQSIKCPTASGIELRQLLIVADSLVVADHGVDVYGLEFCRLGLFLLVGEVACLHFVVIGLCKSFQLHLLQNVEVFLVLSDLLSQQE